LTIMAGKPLAEENASLKISRSDTRLHVAQHERRQIGDKTPVKRSPILST
jgi:hypothetical protein